MSDLEPKFTTTVEFPYAEVLSAESELAQWIANLARAVDDLLLANRRLVAGFETGPSHEVNYDIKAVASDAWELAKFLRSSEASSAGVRTLIAKLPQAAQNDYRQALAALADPAPGEERTFKRHLASARDQASHYSGLDHKLLKRALKRLETDERGEPRLGSLQIGETFKDFYARFGTEVDEQLFFPLPDGDTTRLEEFASELNEVVGSLIRFATTAIQTYLSQHEEALRVSPVDEHEHE